MDVDEDDDFYAPEEPTGPPPGQQAPAAASPPEQKTEQHEDLEEGEEEDEGGAMDEDDSDDSDIDIITERKDGTNAAPPAQSKYSEIRNIPQRTTSNDATVKSAPIKREGSAKASGGSAELPPVSTSKIDVNAIPTHKGTGKPITQVNIDEDLPENGKPWRKPGTDITDYFNYGFDEFTWALYAAKQEALRGEYSQDIVAQNNKKMMEDLNNMMMMGGMPGMSMPGMPGAPAAGGAAGGAAASNMAAVPGMDGFPPEMQAFMQQMMASGMDPSQMDPSAMSAMMAGMQNPGVGAGAGGQGGQNQNFGGAGFGGNQGQGYGYDQQSMGGGNRGGFGGARGRGGRRNW
ncbi:Fip1-domain-containing protein [Pleurostoma richardsiae]|uniref:Fip1-domain-containing protein n=1 Tax=Pleurostoma richardsiae TaxID=41990 RepID=A0AA38VRT1_9PEZI|nr:Fip1-domain-containing protein [Pleurostoma richardsiae]